MNGIDAAREPLQPRLEPKEDQFVSKLVKFIKERKEKEAAPLILKGREVFSRSGVKDETLVTFIKFLSDSGNLQKMKPEDVSSLIRGALMQSMKNIKEFQKLQLPIDFDKTNGVGVLFSKEIKEDKDLARLAGRTADPELIMSYAKQEGSIQNLKYLKRTYLSKKFQDLKMEEPETTLIESFSRGVVVEERRLRSAVCHVEPFYGKDANPLAVERSTVEGLLDLGDDLEAFAIGLSGNKERVISYLRLDDEEFVPKIVPLVLGLGVRGNFFPSSDEETSRIFQTVSEYVDATDKHEIERLSNSKSEENIQKFKFSKNISK